MSLERFGLSCAIATPFGSTGSIDHATLTRHARWCLAEGCDGVTLFGTTGEGFSLSLNERGEVLEAFRQAGFDMRRQVCAGIMATSVEEAAAQAAKALSSNVKALLLAPPFYLKGVGDDGVFAWHSALFDALGDKARDVILYHLPYHTGVAITLDLIERLRAAFPSVICGVKDSAGDWHHTEQLLARHGDIAILVGDERHLARAVRQGGQGAISAASPMRKQDGCVPWCTRNVRSRASVSSWNSFSAYQHCRRSRALLRTGPVTWAGLTFARRWCR